jgi:hypothetical protein
MLTLKQIQMTKIETRSVIKTEKSQRQYTVAFLFVLSYLANHA